MKNKIYSLEELKKIFPGPWYKYIDGYNHDYLLVDDSEDGGAMRYYVNNNRVVYDIYNNKKSAYEECSEEQFGIYYKKYLRFIYFN